MKVCEGDQIKQNTQANKRGELQDKQEQNTAVSAELEVRQVNYE